MQTLEIIENRRSRSAAAMALPPLAVIAITFFLPFVRACSSTPSPAEYIGGECSALTVAWVAPPFAAAALLALLTALALWHGRAPGRVIWRVALLGLGACFGAAAICVTIFGRDLHGRGLAAMMGMAWPVAAIGLGALPLFFARRRGPWTAWVHLLGSFAALASVHCIWVVAEIADGKAATGVGSGGWLYFGSVLALGGVAVHGMLRASPEDATA
jgi:hypothetical protein